MYIENETAMRKMILKSVSENFIPDYELRKSICLRSESSKKHLMQSIAKTSSTLDMQ